MKNKIMGRRFDGGKSPLSGRAGDIGDFPHALTSAQVLGGIDVLGSRGYEPTKSDAIHPVKDKVTTYVVHDMERLVGVRTGRLESDVVRKALVANGVDPDNIQMTRRERIDLHNKLVRFLKEKLQERDANRESLDYESTYEALLAGKDDDAMELVSKNGTHLRSTIADLRRALRISIEDFLALPPVNKLKRIRRAIDRLIETGVATERVDYAAYKQARTDLHIRLRQWARGTLKLERPTGSSFHHLMNYDKHCTEGSASVFTAGECQIVLVENDWGAAVPQVDGEWRVPFAFICWEFRLSGVRVLAFTEADREPARMWCCYGAEGHWVSDDYSYEIGRASLPSGTPFKDMDVDPVEFRRVVKVCYDTIRASCIMLDAQVARQAHVAASSKLKEKRAREGKAPPRDHYVVRLLHEERRSYHRARSAGGATGVDRAPQRGHWRKGTWVHYDDQDSGQVQYTNDGGFVVSKTWRRWHFAGDPKNIIHKTYSV